MAKYKTIAVDDETADVIEELCAAYGRSKGAQVKYMAKVELVKLRKVKSIIIHTLPKKVCKKTI